MPIVGCYGLRKSYGNTIAVHDVTFEIEEGDIFGFIGPNGAGKTTTIKMLATLLRPDAGHIVVDGFDVLRQQEDVRRVIGYMPDFFGVYDDVKVWEYLDFFAAAYKIERARRPALIDNVLELTDLGVKKDSFVEELSRGMKQRLCLAKTLLHDPRVLFLDEPASGLDPRARIEIRELLKELAKLGKTILISSHILTEMADFVTKIGIIEAGRMVVTGGVSEIMEQLEPRKRIEILVASDIEQARAVLEGIEQVQNIRTNGTKIQIEYAGEGNEFASVLPALIHAGVVVTGFGEQEADLEEIFLRVTQGIVQ